MATLNIGNLIASVGLNTADFNRGIANVKGGISGVSTSLVNFGKMAVVPIAAVATAFVGLGTAAVSAANSVDDAMATIRVGTGATGDALAGLESSFRTVFANVPSDAATVGTAIADLNTRLGLTGVALENAATQYTELARITGTDVSTVIKNATRLFGDFSVATEDQADALDYLFKVAQSTGGSVDTLANRATQYGTSLRGMGFDLKTSVALLGKFEKEGVNTETILASLKIGMSNLARAGVTDARKAFSMLIGDIKNANTPLEATAKAIEIFGSRAAADMTMAIREGRFEIDDLIESVEASSETILQAADDSMTLGDRFDKLKNKLTLKLEPFGDAIISQLESIIAWVESDGITIIQPLIDGFQKIVEWWDADGKGVIDSISGGFKWIGDTLKPLIDLFTSFWGDQASKMTEFWETDGALIMAAVANIGNAIETMVEKIAAVWTWLWPYLENIMSPAIDVLLDLIGVFAALFAGDWDALKTKLIDLTLSIVDLVYSIFESGFDLLMQGLTAFANAAGEVIVGAMNAVLDAIESALNSAIGMINSVISAMNQVPGVNIPLIAEVKFEDIEPPKFEAPTLRSITGIESPSEIIREIVGIPEEESILPEPTTIETVVETPVIVETPAAPVTPVVAPVINVAVSAPDTAVEVPDVVTNVDSPTVTTTVESPEVVVPDYESPTIISTVETPQVTVVAPEATVITQPPVEITEPDVSVTVEPGIPDVAITVEPPEIPDIPPIEIPPSPDINVISEPSVPVVTVAPFAPAIDPVLDAIASVRTAILGIPIPGVSSPDIAFPDSIFAEILKTIENMPIQGIIDAVKWVSQRVSAEVYVEPIETVESTEEEEATPEIVREKTETKTVFQKVSEMFRVPEISFAAPDIVNISEIATVPEIVIPQAPVVTMPNSAESGGDLHITTEIDGYAVGRAIYKNYARRTGGGISG